MPPTITSSWSEDDWRESIMRYQLRIKADTIERLATKLEHVGEFPTETPSKLSQLIRKSARIIGEHLEITPPDQLTNVNFLLCWIAEHLRFIERSQIANTPWSMIQGAEKFLKKQAGSVTNFIIRPQWSYNYSIIGDFVEAYRTHIQPLTWIPISDWEASIGELSQNKIYCIGFPRIERLNCLLHANWGHEIGHIIAKEWIDRNFEALWQLEETQIKNKIESEINQNPPPSPPLFQNTLIQQMVANVADIAMRAAKQGFTELICDAIGVHLFGPSALAAAIAFSAPLAIDESPLTCDMYPPWRYRIRLMLKLCEQDMQEHNIESDDGEVMYPGPVIEPFWNWLKEATNLVQNTADTISLQSNIATREAYRVIDVNRQQVHQQTLNLLPSGSTEPYHLFKQVRIIEHLVHKLEHDIPPNEIGKWPDNSPASLENILNAAWVFKIACIQQNTDWASTDNFEKLHRLILKATEVSFVHNYFGTKLKGMEKK